MTGCVSDTALINIENSADKKGRFVVEGVIEKKRWLAFLSDKEKKE